MEQTGFSVSTSNARDMYEEGLNYEHGLDKDEYKARQCYVAAAALNYGPAQSQLAEFYFYGKGSLPLSEEMAFKYFHLSADNEDAKGQCNLGMFYENGMARLAKDNNEAARYYHLAADQGLPAAQNNLATMYEYGKGRRKDLNRAKVLYKLAAESGNKQGIYNFERICALHDGL
jgi:TPR repeat protein